MKFFWIMLLLLPFYLDGSLGWNKTSPGGFGVQVAFSSAEVVIPEILKVELSLTYPRSYYIDSERLQANLLSHSPLKEAPFILIPPNLDQQTYEKDGNVIRKIVFQLQPQLPGTFVLTFYAIQFFP